MSFMGILAFKILIYQGCCTNFNLLRAEKGRATRRKADTNLMPVSIKLSYKMSRYSSVGIATRYGLDGAEIESRWGRDILTRPDWSWCPPSLLYNGYRAFLRDKAAGALC